jgi:predicted 3-demethylubiquinone-9 3-methyltransferase (glyoxalase superfamily)
MRKITPFLWFESQADEAAQFYVSVFKNAKLLHSDAISASVELEGQELHLFNGGPHFKLSPAFSLFVACKTQGKIDELWEKLTADGGKPSQCGWLEDKYGVSWQIAPSILVKYLTDPDPVKAGRVRDIMMPMQKLDLAALQRAYNGA